VEVIKLLEGIIDIYMPDAKFADPETAQKYCKAPDYPEVNKQALKEMHRQTGVLKINRQGIAERGLLIRHLVMPGGLAESKKILKFYCRRIIPESYVNIMAQYYPQFEGLPAIRRLTAG
jgi:putative pyruvate formate lyase activating enzyme